MAGLSTNNLKGNSMPASWVGLGTAALGAYSASKNGKQAGSTTSTQQQQMDPRMQELLYGSGAGSSGLLQQIAQQAQQGQTGGVKQFGSGIDSYLGGYGLDNFMRSQQNAQKLAETTNAAPQMANTQGVNVSTVNGAQVNAPAQNGINLTGAYDKFINGNAGANPYLTSALQSGVDQTNTAFNKNQTDLTNNLQRNVLPGIRSNSVLAGQYGGTRQGIAEGNAIGDYTNQLNSNNLALAQANSANTTGAQAQAFNQGQDRSLAATQGLGAQQYGLASQNASNQQQANLANQNAFQNAETTNAGLRQGTNSANLAAQLQTIGQNDQRNTAGIGLSSALLGQANNIGNASSTADWQKLLQGTNAIGGLSGMNGSSTSSQPYFTNTAGNALGGAAAGLGLYNAYNKAANGYGGSGGGVGSSQDYVNNNWFTS